MSWASIGPSTGTRFRQLVLAQIIEPTSKLDSLRVLEETGIIPLSYATLGRRMLAFADPAWRARLSPACAVQAGLAPASNHTRFHRRRTSPQAIPEALKEDQERFRRRPVGLYPYLVRRATIVAADTRRRLPPFP